MAFALVNLGTGPDTGAADTLDAAFLKVNGSLVYLQTGAAPIALFDAATIAVDGSLANVYTVTLAGNRTLGFPTNPVPGRSYQFFIYQDATGGRTLAYASGWKFANGIVPTLSTAAGALDILSATYDGTKLAAVLSKGFA